MTIRLLLAAPLSLYLLAALPIGYAADDWCELLWRESYGLGTIAYLHEHWTGKFTYALQIGLLKGLIFPGITSMVAIILWVVLCRALYRSYSSS